MTMRRTFQKTPKAERNSCLGCARQAARVGLSNGRIASRFDLSVGVVHTLLTDPGNAPSYLRQRDACRAFNGVDGIVYRNT